MPPADIPVKPGRTIDIENSGLLKTPKIGTPQDYGTLLPKTPVIIFLAGCRRSKLIEDRISSNREISERAHL